MNKKMLLVATAVLICYNVIGSISFPANEYENSICGDGETRGICKSVLNCPSAEDALMHRRPHGLERCGFDAFTEIVCCTDFNKPSNTFGSDWSVPVESKTKKPESRNPIIGTRKSEAACKEYSNEVPPDITLQILGGENASLGEFPHMASLGYESDESEELQWECGGSLISDRFVLTAAHCVIKADGTSPVRVRLGVIDITSTDQIESKDFGIINITVHHQYQRRSKSNDIALIKLDRIVPNNKHIHPACLYQKNDDPIGLVITGWGYTQAGGNPSTILQKAILRPVPTTECTTVYENRLSKSITSSQMCAISDDGTKDTCQGDSGGPIQVQEESGSSIYSIVGVTSYGMGCGGKTPGIYTRVYSYLNWIEKIVWP